jgi:amidophosphoribosyltransferase
MSGLFGVASRQDCRDLLFYGTDYQSHLGTEFGGLAVAGVNGIFRKIHSISQDQFKSRFYTDYKNLVGNKGIGVISANEPQPMLLDSRFGIFAVCMDGNVANIDELVKELHDQGVSFGETVGGKVNSTEVVARLISLGDNIIDGIQKMHERIHGAASLLVLTKDGVYAARDKHGHSPLVIGEKEGVLAVATESSAFLNLDLEIKKALLPGEIVLLNENGLAQRVEGSDKCQICAFLWIYTGFPASHYEGISVETVRERCGACLAKDDTAEADYVAGVPDSGTAHAIGYAMAKGIPYRRPLVKYTAGYGRSYTPPSQEIRDLVAKMKLVPIKDVIRGSRIVVCDDSIVRGTQFRNFTVQKLWSCGARAVHVRPACPPLMFPCRYNISTRSIDELAARRAIRAIEGRALEDVSDYVDATSEKYRRMVEWIANDLGVTSLKYQRLEDMVEAIGLPKDRLCLYCWTGRGT